jgi:hypothetical protein
MKELPKVLILVLAGFACGFAAQSVLAVGFRKMRTAEFLAYAQAEVHGLRKKVEAFKTQKGRFPKDAAEMAAAGFWSPAEPPVERLRGSGAWVTAYDGEGGFVYLSATGQIYLNTDLKREKLRHADQELLMHGDLLPPGTFF